MLAMMPALCLSFIFCSFHSREFPLSIELLQQTIRPHLQGFSQTNNSKYLGLAHIVGSE